MEDFHGDADVDFILYKLKKNLSFTPNQQRKALKSSMLSYIDMGKACVTRLIG